MIPLTSKEDAPIQSKYPVCREYDYELKHYCETCDQLVCIYCTMKEHNDRNHYVLKKIVGKHKQQWKDSTIDGFDDSDLVKKKRLVTTKDNCDDKLSCVRNPHKDRQLYRLTS